MVPLLVAAFTALAAAISVLERKSLAQAVCVNEASTLGDELGRRLAALVRLNPLARRLRRERRIAEAARDAARRILNPPAIALAEARLAAVRLAQTALDVRQRSLLAEADLTRRRHHAAFRVRVARLRAARVKIDSPGAHALAVRATPPREVAPEYEPTSDFARRQRQTYAFDVTLTPDFARALVPRAVQRTSCSVTLERRRSRWLNSIVAASAASNSR